MSKKPYLLLGAMAIIVGFIISYFILPVPNFVSQPTLTKLTKLTKLTDHEVKLRARRASVQPVFYIPVLKVWFSTPLEEDKEVKRSQLEKILQEKIQEALEKERELQKIDKYETRITEIDVWGYQPRSKTEIPLRAFAPDYVKFPEKVLVVYKTEKKDIMEWEKEYEKDVLAISEIANVSPRVAKSIVSRLRAEGYSISKESIAKESEIELLWFDDGWDDNYPITLSWSVEVEGTNQNIITGYDPFRAVLIVKPIPDDMGEIKRVHVKAGYLDLLAQYKPKSKEILDLEKEVERYRKKERENMKKPPKRDISKATWNDVRMGTVNVEQFWVMTAASGIFLGNMQVSNEIEGFTSYWGGARQYVLPKSKGVVLTNAHVAVNAIKFTVYISKDKEVMYIIYPGDPFIRYTQDSDYFGSPAQLLTDYGAPILSSDFDTALMVTTQVPQYEQYKAILGDSDKVKEGDEVIMVGNPMYLQKFLTRGVVSNKSYDIMKSFLVDRWLNEGISKRLFNWARNSSFWFDTPIGIGGTSGSGVWAMSGSEKGKVIALHNMGMVQPTAISYAKRISKDAEDPNIDMDIDIDIDIESFNNDKRLIRLSAKDMRKFLFQNYSYRDAKFAFNISWKRDIDEEFLKALQEHGAYVDVSGMNAGIPINTVKRFLQERGIDPENFGWKGVSKEYWEK
jgi:hypothetical protein